MKYCLLLFKIIFFCTFSRGQSIKNATISSLAGRSYSGNLMLNYTIGQPFDKNSSSANSSISTGFWNVADASYIPLATLVYYFRGNGNFDQPQNWDSGLIPPNPLPANAEIIIDPAANGECILNIVFQVSPGAKFSVMAGKKLKILGSLVLQ